MRHLTAGLAAFAWLLAAPAARGEQLLNVELTGGAGLTAYNSGSESLLAPPHVTLSASYLLVRAGPVTMGPSLSLPLGFFRPDGDEDGPLSAQLALRPGFEVFGRPSADIAWSVAAGPSLVVTPDFVWGLEVGGAFSYFLTAGIGLTAGLDYGFFYGVDPVHVFTFRLGVLVSWEVAS